LQVDIWRDEGKVGRPKALIPSDNAGTNNKRQTGHGIIASSFLNTTMRDAAHIRPIIVF